MLKSRNKHSGQATAKAGQAATELAVFGAVLIFILGSIVRTSVGQSYTQNQNFKAMRMAMLTSWNGSKAHPNNSGTQDTSRNNAQVVFIEDRLSPDPGKYGDLDRTPFIAAGSGTFSYNLLYPLSDRRDRLASVPIVDEYINGQHFPFSMASYVLDKEIVPPSCNDYPTGSDLQNQCLRTQNPCLYPAGSCEQNRCLRNQREWVFQKVYENDFSTGSMSSVSTITGTCLSQPKGLSQRTCQSSANSCTIFQDLVAAGMFKTATITGKCPYMQGVIDPALAAAGSLENSSAWASFQTQYYSAFSYNTDAENKKYLNAILTLLESREHPYKLFYTFMPNPSGIKSSTKFTLTAPDCTNTKDMALCKDLQVFDANGNWFTNTNGDMQYDLQRLGYYTSPPPICANPPCQSVEQQFPLCSTGSVDCMRNYVAWQWAATPGKPGFLGIDNDKNVYPSYDIDGTLKEKAIYSLKQDSDGIVHVSYVDGQGGDIDGTWDANSCGPRPGLQPDAQVYTFTKKGTYLRMNEGKLYNPETGNVVRSANKRDTIDLIQRTIQLSNNTGRFCSAYDNSPLPYVGADCKTATCPGGSKPCVFGSRCSDGSICPNGISSNCPADELAPMPGNAVGNPVETCVNEKDPQKPCNCFMGSNPDGTPVNPTCGDTFRRTCYDTSINMIFIRSRLEDRRGRFWETQAGGQLKVQQ